MSYNNMSYDPNKTWWQNHDAEVFIWSLYLVFKIAAAFVNPDDNPYLYATWHGHADDTLGVGLMLVIVKYFWEKTSE